MPANTRTKYESDDAAIYALTLTPDYAAKAGTPPTGAVTSPIKAKVSKSTRAFGIKPRGVTLSRTLGTAPDTFTKTAFLPVLTPAAFGSAGFALGATITIGSTAWTVVGKRSEDY
jgi:hypothetical protein